MKNLSRPILLWIDDKEFAAELEMLINDYFDQYPMDEEEILSSVVVPSFDISLDELRYKLSNRKGRKIIFVQAKDKIDVTNIEYEN